ncbi:ATP-grasp domain-containing protein [Tumebacillus flagellatus]|nr:ATP-grasp domain-containing protein [Tumebacillus flagellatus]
MKNLHNKLISQRALELGYSCRLLVEDEEDFLELSNGERTVIVNKTRSHRLPAVAGLITKNKRVCSALLKRHDLPVPDEISVRSCTQEALNFLDSHGTVVVKPVDTNRGVGITMDVRTPDELKQAIQNGQAYGRDLLVQQQIHGRDYRVLVIDGEIVGVLENRPPQVTGDGRSSVYELIQALNADPARTADKDEFKPMLVVQIDEEVKRILATQGFSLSSVPAAGTTIYLRKNGNEYTGGMNIDRTDDLCPENAAICLEAARVLGLDVAGLDIRTPDISRSMRETGGTIIEVNVLPGMNGHMFPAQGTPRDSIGKYLQYLFRVS